MALYAGLMSGTSLDGIDGVLADIDGSGAVTPRRHAHAAFAPALAAELAALNDPGGRDELHRAALAAGALADACAALVLRLLAEDGSTPADIVAIGAHGQTVRHRPGDVDGGGAGYTLQLLDGARLAERSGIDVVCDFRSRDVAAGGQGAPLVPAFHAGRYGRAGHAVAVLNVGGIANLTLLPADGGSVTGFDCGPGNGLMDLWCRRQRGTAYDADGAWAATGSVDSTWLASLLASEPYFALPPPKSTGRDLFNAGWLSARLPQSLPPADVMATLAELTARSVADALQRHAPETTRLVVCGGGARNRHLMQQLQALLPALDVRRSDAADGGIAPDQVEALAFAWLAWAHVARRPGNIASVTGARGPRVLGALYPR